MTSPPAPVPSSLFLRWRGALTTAIVVSLPLAAAALYVKHRLLGLGVWRSALPRPEGPLDYASYFAADAVEALVVMPLAMAVCLGWLPGRRRVLAMSLIVALLCAVVAAGWLTLLGTGAWPTPGLVRDFVNAVGTDAGLVDPSGYLPGRALIRAGILIILGLAPLLLVVDRIGRPVFGTTAVQRSLLLAPLLALGGAMGAARPEESAGLRRGVISRVVAGLLPGATTSPAGGGDSPDISAEWSWVTYPDRAHSDLAAPPPPPADRACRSAILVILETAADRDYSWDSLRAAMPMTREYLDRAVVARRHFASHPWSNRSDFTMLGGVYDLTDDRPLQTYLRRAHAPADSAPGITALLRRRGYDLRYYYPGRFTVEDDAWAVGYLGFEHVFAPALRHEDPGVQARLAREGQIFRQAAADLRSLDHDRPFLVVLRTMLGHDPVFSPRTGKYLDPTRTGARAETYRDVLAYLDSLMHEVIEAASEHEDPNRLAIAFLGDHGIRNRMDPDLTSQSIPLLMYRVPAVIGCPAVFERPVFTTHATSHVDVSPTLAWVLGLDPGAASPHGLVMTDSRLQHRYTFLFAAKTGVDALIRGDTITAVNRVYGSPARAVLDSSGNRATVIDGSSANLRQAESRFASLRRVQYKLVERLSRGRGQAGAR